MYSYRVLATGTQVHVDLHCYALCRYKCTGPKNIPSVEQAQDQTAESAAWSQKVVVRVVEVVVFGLRGLRACQEFELTKVAETVAVLERMVVPSQQAPL